ncbi:MAG: response regulator [Candidatus Levybacteria bacterium]|nr:response regulator [Candidatus Levybacteria bacterium]
MAQRVLIVDDDQYLRELYEEVLKDAGYAVETAEDGVDGLTKLQQGGYDLTLLDVVMPRLDGLGVLTSLSQNPPATKNGPILLLTNLAHDSIVKEAIDKGATSYIIKTDITPDQLLEDVKKTLQQ